MSRNITPDKIKLIAIDLDGTLLTWERNVAKKNIEILQKLQWLGMKIIIVTGANEYKAQNIGKIVGIDQYLNLAICYNGGVITKISDIEMVDGVNLEPKDLETFINWAVQNEVGLTVNGKLTRDFRTANESEAKLNQLKAQLASEKIYQYVFYNYDHPEYIDRLEKQFLTWNQKPNPEYIGYRTEPACYDVCPANVSKARGLELVLNRLNISPTEVMAIGDNYNDIPMLKYVGYPVAMANAVPELKAVAKTITTVDNDHGGVGIFLEKFFNLK